MAYASLTGAQAIALFRDAVDDQSVDTDLILSFLNTAQDELALERAWTWLEAHDITTIDWLTSDTYRTQHSVPSDMLYQLEVFVDGFDFPFIEVPFKLRERYKDISYRVAWDHRQRKLHFMGSTSQNRDVFLSYIVKPTEIANDSTEIANWPGVAHRMIVYHAIMLWLGGTDADNITKLMRAEFAGQLARLKQRAIMLDAKLRGKARGYQSFSPTRNISKNENIVDIDG